jgi:hypothetical protein
MVGGVPVVTAPAEIDVTTAGQLRAMPATKQYAHYIPMEGSS